MNKKITHHIQFSPEDEKKIRDKAEQAGMTVTAYIKSKALNSRARRKPIRIYPIVDHIEALDKVVEEIRKITTNPHKDRWLYEADLERIDRKLDELLQTEQELAEKIWR